MNYMDLITDLKNLKRSFSQNNPGDNKAYDNADDNFFSKIQEMNLELTKKSGTDRSADPLLNFYVKLLELDYSKLLGEKNTEINRNLFSAYVEKTKKMLEEELTKEFKIPANDLMNIQGIKEKLEENKKSKESARAEREKGKEQERVALEAYLKKIREQEEKETFLKEKIKELGALAYESDREREDNSLGLKDDELTENQEKTPTIPKTKKIGIPGESNLFVKEILSIKNALVQKGSLPEKEGEKLEETLKNSVTISAFQNYTSDEEASRMALATELLGIFKKSYEEEKKKVEDKNQKKQEEQVEKNIYANILGPGDIAYQDRKKRKQKQKQEESLNQRNPLEERAKEVQQLDRKSENQPSKPIIPGIMVGETRITGFASTLMANTVFVNDRYLTNKQYNANTKAIIARTRDLFSNFSKIKNNQIQERDFLEFRRQLLEIKGMLGKVNGADVAKTIDKIVQKIDQKLYQGEKKKNENNFETILVGGEEINGLARELIENTIFDRNEYPENREFKKAKALLIDLGNEKISSAQFYVKLYDVKQAALREGNKIERKNNASSENEYFKIATDIDNIMQKVRTQQKLTTSMIFHTGAKEQLKQTHEKIKASYDNKTLTFKRGIQKIKENTPSNPFKNKKK